MSQKSVGPNENYGNLSHDPFLKLTECQIEIYKRTYLDKISLSQYQIESLELRTKRQNQCEEWYIKRKKRFVFTKIKWTGSML